MKRNKSLTYLYLFLFTLSVFLFFGNGHYGGDGLQNYLAAKSIFLDGKFIIQGHTFAVKEMASASQTLPAGTIGMPLLLVPLYSLGQLIAKIFIRIPPDYITQFTVSLANPLITALISLLLFIFLENLGFKKKTCLTTVLCFSFSTMSLIYTRSGFSDPAITLFVLLAFLFMHTYEKNQKIRYLFFASIFVGYTLLIKRNSFLYLPLLILYLLYKTIKIKDPKSVFKIWLAILLPVLFFISAYFWFSSFFIAGDYSGVYQDLKESGSFSFFNVFKGGYYYLFSPGKGFFFYNLPLLLSLFAIKGFFMKRKKISVYVLCFIIVNLVFYFFKFTRGTLFSWGPRYLYPVVPFLCLFLAEFIENAKSWPKKALFWLLAWLGFLIQIPVLFVNLTSYLMFVKEKLNLPEYLINFMPELSPLRGNLMVFSSAIYKGLTGISLNFKYGPDNLFLAPVIKNLNGYDTLDIWWINIIKVHSSLFYFVLFGCLILITIIIISVIKLNNLINDEYAPNS